MSGSWTKKFWDWFLPPEQAPASGAASEVPANVDLYGILEMDPSASMRELRARYIELAKKYHPDRDPRPEAQAYFQSVTAAYNILADPEKRDAYDNSRGITTKGKKAAEKMKPPEPAPPPKGPFWKYMYGTPEEVEREEKLSLFEGLRPSSSRERTHYAEERPRTSYVPSPFKKARAVVSAEAMADWIRKTWDLEGIWKAVGQVRGTPEFEDAGRIAAISRLSGAENQEYRLAESLGVPRDVMRDYERGGRLSDDFWTEILGPLIDAFPAAMDVVKPQGVPGKLFIYPAADKSGVDLFYSEQR